MHGKSAKDLYLKVPVGTIVKDLKTDSIIADLTHNKQTVLVAKVEEAEEEILISAHPKIVHHNTVNRENRGLNEICN